MSKGIYCVYYNKNVPVMECLDCDKLYDCDVNWCDNHDCLICENRRDGFCKGENL